MSKDSDKNGTVVRPSHPQWQRRRRGDRPVELRGWRRVVRNVLR